jgi:branched-chain amino acid transport system permease protein
MITLALGQCVWGLAYRWNSLTGGDDGINLRGRPNFGLDLSNEVTFFYLVFAFFAVSMMLMYVLVRSPFARSLAGIRDHELRMQILGYNTWLHKYIAFIIAGGFGGQYALGGVYVLTILYLPMGLMGIPARIRQRLTSQAKDESSKKLVSQPS